MKQQTKTVGVFDVSSGKLMVSDPCYEPGTWCHGVVPATNGMWIATVVIVDARGVCSSSGYGDGGYSGYVFNDAAGNAPAVRVVFIED